MNSKKRAHQNNRNSAHQQSKKSKQSSSHQEVRFKHGNYNRYYGYRNADHEMDKRIPLFKKEWFENKSCLDIGCNVGHLTLWIAKHFQPAKMKGVDIDPDLIRAAKSNILHYADTNKSQNNVRCDENKSQNNDKGGTNNDDNKSENNSKGCNDKTQNNVDNDKNNSSGSKKAEIDKDNKDKKQNNVKDNNCEIQNITEGSKIKMDGNLNKDEENKNENIDKNNKRNTADPSTSLIEKEVEKNCTESSSGKQDVTSASVTDASNALTNKVQSDIRSIPTNKSICDNFPTNVSFSTESYVPSSIGILKYTKPLYDVILCLSVTKWIQLNSGDEGLKLTFKKIYKQLHENGIFVLEPQPYESYKRRKNITPEIRKNYDSITLKPENYMNYLLSEEVGFKSYEEIAILQHEKQGLFGR